LRCHRNSSSSSSSSRSSQCTSEQSTSLRATWSATELQPRDTTVAELTSMRRAWSEEHAPMERHTVLTTEQPYHQHNLNCHHHE
ncbi:hypothetical protein PENTCL1PPCAC_9062, partial [Pristionchus entomophagus]